MLFTSQITYIRIITRQNIISDYAHYQLKHSTWLISTTNFRPLIKPATLRNVDKNGILLENFVKVSVEGVPVRVRFSHML